MITGIDHVELRVADLKRALAFYRDTLGLVDHTPDSAMHFLGTESDAFLVLVAGDEGGGAGGTGALDHLAFAVPDVEAARRALAEQGVAFGSERTDADGRGRSYYFRDPDGNRLEIYGSIEAREHLKEDGGEAAS